MNHTWAIEEVNGGPVGTDDFYRCTACGCSGGSTYRADGTPIDPQPFLPGPAMNLDNDCDVAHEQILAYVKGYLAGIRPAGLPKVYVLLVRANRWTPSERPRVAFYHLVTDCEWNWGKQDEGKVRRRLIELGFRVESTKCSTCGNSTDRPGDDTDTRCYGCAWSEFSKARGKA